MSVDFVTPAPEIPRDHYSRPLVVPPTGGKAVPYTRATTFVDCLEDKFNLQKWMQRMVAVGLADRPDLLLAAVAAHRNDKSKLDRICDEAREAAAASASATTGTALHALAEQYDRGELDLARVPASSRPDLDAYVAATAEMRHLHIEQFAVHDGLKIGGTPDRVVDYQGGTYIADLKTGSVEFGALKIAMQLAVYSHSVVYDHVSRQRTPLTGVSHDRAIVIHLPAGEGTCRLLWVDIAAGWEAVQVARAVRDWRTRRDLMAEITTEVVTPVVAPARDLTLLDLIASVSTIDSLTELWRLHAFEWTDVHTAAAAERKKQLAGAA